MLDSEDMPLSPEDIYALHCAWELKHKGHPEAPPEVDGSAGRAILARYNPDFGKPSLRLLNNPAHK